MHSEVEAAAVDGLGRVYRPRHGATRPPGSPCANCGATLAGPWCHDCGQLAEDFHRSVLRLMMEMVEGITHFDGRLWRTAPTLAIKPAKLTREYIDGHRASQIPPLRLFLVVLLIFFVAVSFGKKQPVLRFDSPADRVKMIDSIDKTAANVSGLRKEDAQKIAWLKSHVKAVIDDPERFRLVLEAQEERFAFLAAPVATLLLALLFAFQRRFFMFDHTIFALHSLSFQGLLFSLISLLGLVTGSLASLLLFLSPVHLFVHMRGVYRTSVLGTLLRMILLAIGSLVAFVVLFIVLLLVGLSAMSA